MRNIKKIIYDIRINDNAWEIPQVSEYGFDYILDNV